MLGFLGLQLPPQEFLPSWVPAVLGLLLGGGWAEFVSDRFNWSHGTKDVGGVCNFLRSVSSQEKFEAPCYSSVLFRK